MDFGAYQSKDLSNEQYHKSDGISKSTLDLIHEAPALVEWSKKAPVDLTAKAAVDFGNIFDCRICEPERFKAEYAVEPKVNKSTNVGKAAIAEFYEANKGKEIISADDALKAEMMFESAMAYPTFRKLYDKMESSQLSIYAKDSYYGVKTKCRVDIPVFLDGDIYFIDIKTIDDIESVPKNIYNYRYHVQDAHYTRVGLDHYGISPIFLFLFVSKKRSAGRYPVRFMSLSADARQKGLEVRNKDIETYMRCFESGIWNGIQIVDLPKWAA